MQENKRIKSPIKSRILQYIQKKGITRYAFYKETGMTRGILDQPTGISEDNLACFVRYAPEVSLEWLICGKGNMIEETSPSSVIYEIPVQNPSLVHDLSQRYEAKTPSAVPEQDSPRIPLYEADSITELRTLLIGEKMPSPEKYLMFPDMSSCDGAFKLRGDAMPPLLRGGDIIVYKQVWDFARIVWGELYVVLFLNGEEEYVTVRCLDRVDGDPNKVKLVNYDSYHTSLEIPFISIRALALVKASVRYHTMG